MNLLRFRLLNMLLDPKNAIVSAVATIVEGLSEEMSEKEIYNTVNDLLKKKL